MSILAITKRHLPALLIIAALAATLVVAAHRLHPGTLFYPDILMKASDTVQVGLLKQGVRSQQQCEKEALGIKQAMQNFCPTCEILRARCVDTLSPRQQHLLSKKAVDLPVMHIPGGVITFEADQRDIAEQTCREAARQAQTSGPCILQDSSQMAIALSALSANQIEITPSSSTTLLILLKLTLFSALVSCAVCGLLIWSEKWHAPFSHDAINSGPQKFHATAVPRIGGLAIACAMVAAITALDLTDILMTDSVHGFAMLALSALPAFAGGLAEDLTKKVGVLARLLLTMAAGVLASVLIGATLTRLDVPGLDNLLQYWPLLAIAFTAFAVGGAANAINIIDGYNGLAAGYAIIALAALAWVSMQVGDQVVLLASLAMLGALFGFVVWNWPGGRIFLGDGGAYLLGFWLAELGVLLVMRNPQVSPWFPLVIMIYPIWETLFSMYRRKIIRQHQVGHPDAMHLHQLVYQRLIRKSSAPGGITKQHPRNSRVAPLLLIPVTLLMLPALLLWHRTDALLVCAGAFCVAYGWLYYRLA
jgi:UDP-N-acetylmuramyl pentapeptide phosphotransferase/UDP-N-acetylglucosamine-1-phosphate transferase